MFNLFGRSGRTVAARSKTHVGLPQGRLTSLPRGSSATGISCLLTLDVVSR